MTNIIKMIHDINFQKDQLLKGIEEDLNVEDARWEDEFPNPFRLDIQFHDGDWKVQELEMKDGSILYFFNEIDMNEEYYFVDIDDFGNSIFKLMGNNYTYFKNKKVIG